MEHSWAEHSGAGRTVPTMCVGRFAAVLFVLAVCFFRGVGDVAPYGAEQNIICRGDHILAKQVCHEAKRNIESPRNVVRTTFRFRTNKRSPSILVGEGLAPPVLCSHYLLASHKRTVSPYNVTWYLCAVGESQRKTGGYGIRPRCAFLNTS